MGNEQEYYWWCPTCKEEVSPQNVTYRGFHDACGTPVNSMPVPQSVPTEGLLTETLEEILKDAMTPHCGFEQCDWGNTCIPCATRRINKWHEAQLAKVSASFSAQLAEKDDRISSLENCQMGATMTQYVRLSPTVLFKAPGCYGLLPSADCFPRCPVFKQCKAGVKVEQK